jgi:serine/threonine-protein kinase HipA
MTVGGESKKPGQTELLGLAKSFAIKKPERIIDEVREAVNRWPEFAQASSVPQDSISRINRDLNP